jgi:predicted KAP-like P-loop ATPase
MARQTQRKERKASQSRKNSKNVGEVGSLPEHEDAPAVDQPVARSLSGDRPITKPDQDLLGFGPFAERVAAAIVHRATTPGIVIGIHGPWGTGKTSALNLIAHHVESMQGRSLKVLRFNPWWFSSSPDLLLTSFFNQLLATIPTTSKALRNARTGLAKLGRVLSKLPMGGAEQYVGAASEAIDPGADDVYRLRENIDRHILKEGTRFLVLIDDLDRLAGEEIYQVFRLVKAIADFSRFTYVVAFDRAIVGKAMSQYVPDEGPAYIDKIVQVPFDLPPVDRASLDQLFFAQLQRIVNPLDGSRFDATRWGNVYRGGIAQLLRTPRDVVRLANALMVSYPTVRDDVDVIDFVAIEALRVFAPQVYRAIADHPEKFTGQNIRGQDPKRHQGWHEAYLDGVVSGSRDAVKEIVRRTFVRVDAIWGGTTYGSNWEPVWRRDGRACSEDRFDLYFRWSVPVGALSRKELEEVLRSTSVAEVRDAVVEMGHVRRPDGTTKARALLVDLESHFHGEDSPFPSDVVLRGLIDAGDELGRSDPDSPGYYQLSTSQLVSGTVYRLLRKLPEQSRVEITELAWRESPSLGSVSSIHDLFRTEHDGTDRNPATPEDQRLTTSAHLDHLQGVLIERIAAAFHSGELQKNPQFASVVGRWRRWTGDKGVGSLVAERLHDDEFLGDFLESLVQMTSGFSSSDRVETRTPMIDMEYVRSYVDPSEFKPRVAKMLAGAKGRRKTALQAFMAQCDVPGDA